MGRRKLGSIYCANGRHLWAEKNLVDYGNGPQCKPCLAESWIRSNERRRQKRIREQQQKEGTLRQ